MKVVVVVYSDDRNVRADVRDALGVKLGGLDLEVRETATQAAVLAELNRGDVDCCIFDGEATPTGGMGLAKQIRDEYAVCPPVLLLVARPADSWLAAWSRADAIHPYPIDPLTLPQQVEELVFVDDDAA
ncbi:MAG: response regulator [Propionibacteriaceae bacterium]|jgi:DNA-binding response OmpR family regulator|nr:response regulator [Propionibacteriaceae bacterium]